MIRLTIAGSLNKILEFIDNRLVLLLSEKGLRQLNPGIGLRVFFKEQFRIKNIVNTVLYLENEPKRATLVVSTAEKSGDKPKIEHFGMTIRSKNESDQDLYLDTLSEAFSKGLISTDAKRKVFSMKSVVIVLIAVLVLLVITLTGGLAFFAICLLAIVLYPVQYLLNKRKFRRTQQKIRKIASLFETEFHIKNKLETNDWLTFWHRVKSDIKSEIQESIPLSFR